MAVLTSPRSARLAVVRSLYGPHEIVGTTKTDGSPSNIPVGRKVRLHDQISGNVLAEMWSNGTTGAYAFRQIRAGVFFVISFDHTGAYSGAVETDVVRPEPMP